MSNPVKVDIWSDIACPWCFVGKRRFERGAEAFRAEGGEVEVEYHSFELSPDTPVDFDGTEVDFLVSHKQLAPAQVRQMLAQMTALAAEEGLSYDFDAVKHTKTLKAHELLHLAKVQGRQQEIAERLFRGYFEQGRHLGRLDELADLAADVGLNREQVLDTLRAGTYADGVKADIEQAARYGIGGVPFYVLNERFAVSGAQPSETFTQALKQAASAAVTEPA